MRAVVWVAVLVVSCGGHTRQSEPRDQGGAGNGNVSSAGNVSVGGSAAPPMQDDCRAMDARPSLDDCSDVVGYAFDGKLCGPIVCGCLGDDCGQLFGSIEACDREYGVCYAKAGIDRSCKSHLDCQLRSRLCCPGCGAPGVDELLATNRGSPDLANLGACAGDGSACGHMCTALPNPSLDSACVDGQCTTLDLLDHTSCAVDSDCHVATKDCCECGADYGLGATVAVNRSFIRPSYCSADQVCDECTGDPSSDDTAFCQRGTCVLISFHIK